MSWPCLHPAAATWAADRGFGMPNRDAEFLGAVDPDRLAGWARVVEGLSPVLNYGRFDVARLADRLAVAWSAPEPCGYLRRLSTAALRVAEIVDGVTATVVPAIGTIRSSRQAAAAAVIGANAAADWDRPGYLNADTEEGRHRTEVCRRVSGELADRRATVEAAMRRLLTVVPVDPGDPVTGLPTPCGRRVPDPTGSASASAADRADDRNRSTLRADMASQDARRRAFAAAVERALAGAERGGAHTGLLDYRPDALDGQGAVSVVVGQLATADHVVVLTPGIGNSPTAMSGTLAAAGELRAEAQRLAPGERTAVVVWFGYDIPASGVVDLMQDGSDLTPPSAIHLAHDALAATDDASAVAGGALLADTTHRIRTIAPSGATLTLVGHSMGAVTTSQAVAGDASADAVVLLGSPGAGAGVDDVHDYPGVTPQQVFALSFDNDIVTRWRTDLAASLVDGPSADGPFGPDPASGHFQAQVIDAPSPAEARRRWLDAIDSPFWVDAGPTVLAEHALPNYLAGAALTQVATVAVGRLSRVRRKQGRSGPG